MAEKADTFHIIDDAKTEPGDTLANLKSAVTGETGASARYSAYAEVAAKEGYDQLARLWRCTAQAEQIHIGFEYNLVTELDPTWEKPVIEADPSSHLDVNLIQSALGEIFETSDMYPTYIKVAQEEGNKKAEFAFRRAKLAEAYHAERYLDAYNNIETPDGETYYLCPICGFIHKGTGIEKCPICGAPFDKFIAY